MTHSKFPWAQLMRTGLHDLKLNPTEFWRSTLHELLHATGTPPASSPMLRQNLLQLMEQYPDDRD